MTEAMSRTEIEDVLSSIKRLVAQDMRRADNVSDGPEPLAPAAHATDGKLLLTDALRVDKPVATASGLTSETQSEARADDNAQALASTAAQPIASNVDDSLLARIARATSQPTAQPAPARFTQDARPSMPEHGPEVTPDYLPEPIQSSIEDKALEATLAQLETALAVGSQHQPAIQDDGDLVIDEGMLNHMVTQIVRRELQGELGERITRNIRKLVRAEVARELQLRDH